MGFMEAFDVGGIIVKIIQLVYISLFYRMLSLLFGYISIKERIVLFWNSIYNVFLSNITVGISDTPKC